MGSAPSIRAITMQRSHQCPHRLQHPQQQEITRTLVPIVAHDAQMQHHVEFVYKLSYRRNPVHYFHHFHLGENAADPSMPAVEHCGGVHVAIDHDIHYTIEHCSCGRHAIDEPNAVGHDELVRKTRFVFTEKCPGDHGGWWHLETGKIV